MMLKTIDEQKFRNEDMSALERELKRQGLEKLRSGTHLTGTWESLDGQEYRHDSGLTIRVERARDQTLGVQAFRLQGETYFDCIVYELRARTSDNHETGSTNFLVPHCFCELGENGRYGFVQEVRKLLLEYK